MEDRLHEEPREWQNLLAITRFCYIEVLFLIFYYCWGKENRSLYRVLRYIEVRYIEVRCIEVRYIEVPLLYWSTRHYYYYYYYWARAQILPREKNGRGGGWWGRVHYLNAQANCFAVPLFSELQYKAKMRISVGIIVADNILMPYLL